MARSRWLMESVHSRVPVPPCDEPVVDRVCKDPGDRQREKQAAPEICAGERRVHRTRKNQHDSVVDNLHHRDGNRIRGKRKRKCPAQRQSTSYERTQGHCIAEHERQHDGEDYGWRVSPPGSGSDDHPQNLSNSATSEAVDRGATREPLCAAAIVRRSRVVTRGHVMRMRCHCIPPMVFMDWLPNEDRSRMKKKLPIGLREP